MNGLNGLSGLMPPIFWIGLSFMRSRNVWMVALGILSTKPTA